jgi:hypothetical protein
VNLKDNLASFVKFQLDNLIDEAVQQDGESSPIGGQAHFIVIYSGGIQAMNP